MIRPKASRKRVVPSSRKYSGVSAANNLRTATTTVRGPCCSAAGRGAGREVCDHILASQGRLDAMLAAYLA